MLAGLFKDSRGSYSGAGRRLIPIKKTGGNPKAMGSAVTHTPKLYCAPVVNKSKRI